MPKLWDRVRNVVSDGMVTQQEKQTAILQALDDTYKNLPLAAGRKQDLRILSGATSAVLDERTVRTRVAEGSHIDARTLAGELATEWLDKLKHGGDARVVSAYMQGRAEQFNSERPVDQMVNFPKLRSSVADAYARHEKIERLKHASPAETAIRIDNGRGVKI